MSTSLALTPPPVAREDVRDGLRVCKRYRHRLGTLVCVARCADQWPVLLVCWDDEPEYVSRVVNYDVTLWVEELSTEAQPDKRTPLPGATSEGAVASLLSAAPCSNVNGASIAQDKTDTSMNAPARDRPDEGAATLPRGHATGQMGRAEPECTTREAHNIEQKCITTKGTNHGNHNDAQPPRRARRAVTDAARHP